MTPPTPKIALRAAMWLLLAAGVGGITWVLAKILDTEEDREVGISLSASTLAPPELKRFDLVNADVLRQRFPRGGVSYWAVGHLPPGETFDAFCTRTDSLLAEPLEYLSHADEAFAAFPARLPVSKLRAAMTQNVASGGSSKAGTWRLLHIPSTGEVVIRFNTPTPY